MKKIMIQISLIFLVIILGMMSTFINSVNAESISLSAGTVNKGECFSVGLTGLPAGAVAYQANVKVTYSDGTTKNFQKISYLNYLGVTDTEQERSTISADVAGTATITLYNIVVTNENSQNIQTTSTATATVNIVDNSVPTTPAPTVATTTPENSASSADSEKKEPEVVNPTFKDVNETVYAVQNCNVRSSCSSEISSNKIGGLKEGQEVTRTGVASGWSRILYNGKTAYVAARLLTTEKPEEKEEQKEEEKTEENTDVENDNTEVTPEEKLKVIQENIGTLPEVGHNIAFYIYITISTFVLGVMAIIVIKNNEYRGSKKWHK